MEKAWVVVAAIVVKRNKAVMEVAKDAAQQAVAMLQD
jgi:hypothetical protein